MHRTFPFRPWQQARCTAAAGRPRSVGQVLLSVRRSTAPARHRNAGETSARAGDRAKPTQRKRSIAPDGHRRAARGSLTPIPRFSPWATREGSRARLPCCIAGSCRIAGFGNGGPKAPRLLVFQRGVALGRGHVLACGFLPARTLHAPPLRLLRQHSEKAPVELAASIMFGQAEPIQMAGRRNPHGLRVGTTDGGYGTVEARTLHHGGARLVEASSFCVSQVTRRLRPGIGLATSVPWQPRSRHDVQPGVSVALA